MKLTVVGYWGGFPAANEATTGYLLESNGFSLLIDCGSAVLSQLQNYMDPTELEALIISHYHHDHVADIGPLQYARMIKTILGECNQELPIFGHALDTEGFSRLTKAPYTKGIAYDPDKVLTVGPFSISFLKTKHPAICFAMRITDGQNTIVYTADSSYQEEFIPFSEKADLLISECNLYAEQDGTNPGHMNSHDAATIAKRAEVKKLLLSHLPHFGDHQQLVEEAKEVYSGPIELAKSGWVWEV